jgi:hypothetical protein
MTLEFNAANIQELFGLAGLSVALLKALCDLFIIP